MYGVPVEITDIMLEIYDFLARETRYLGSIDNDHNIHNDIYQIIGVYFIFYVEKLVVYDKIFLKSQVSPALTCPKDFTSDNIFQKLTSYINIKKLDDAISDGCTVGKIEDIGGLGCTILFTRLHMHEVNGRTSPQSTIPSIFGHQ